jgi:hypothetical protein
MARWLDFGCSKKKGKFMRFGIIVSLAMLGCFAAPPVRAEQLPAPAWQEYRSTVGGYRVEVPGKPAELTQDVPTHPGQKMYAIKVDYGKGGFVIVLSEMAADRVGAGAEQNLDLIRDSGMKALNATVINEQHETVGEFPGRRVDYNASNGLSGTVRYVLAERRIYQINAIGPAGFSATPEAKRFLASFALMGR